MADGDKGDGDWGWKFFHGDGGGADFWAITSVVVEPLEDEATGWTSFDFGLTIGDIVWFSSPPSHFLFSSNNARRSPCH